MEGDSIASYLINFDTVGDLVSKDQRLVINMATIPDEDDEKEEFKLDFNIILIDSMGNSGQLKLSEIKSIIPPLQVQYLKLKDVNDDIYGNTWEAALDDVRIDLDRFGDEVDLTAIKQIEFRFDQTDRGKIFINEIGVEEN